MIRYDILPTRCGDLLVAINKHGLVHVDFVAGLRALPDMSHRVIGQNGSLTGYAGGLEIKKALLALERGN